VNRSAPADPALISRAWRRVAMRTALVFAVALSLVDAVAAGLLVRADRADVRATIAQVLAHPTDPPPVGVWVYRWAGGPGGDPGAAAPTRSGDPSRPLDPAALRAVAAGGAARTGEVERGQREYLVRTARTGGATVQVVLDETYRERVRHQTFASLLVAGAVGIGLSVLVGALVARRSILPLGEALERQRRFVADASHELRTPLAQLHTRAQLLDRAATRADPGGDLAADARALVAGTRQLGDLVEDLLLAAAQRADPAQAAAVDLADLAGQVVVADRERAAQRGVRLTLESDGSAPYLVRGVPVALRRVLVALVDNALGHVAAGGHVAVRLAHGDRGVSCRVRDDGVGFAPAEADRIFQRFARGAHGDGRRFGLGLALVRQVVSDHGGSVTATAQPGAGATFEVWLPAATGPAATPASADPATPASADPADPATPASADPADPAGPAGRAGTD
jgi:two-component system OmpR family sensor kinase